MLRARRSDCDIDFTVALDDVEFLQPDARVADMRPVREMVFVAVPRADDVHVRLVEALAEEDAVLADMSTTWGIRTPSQAGPP